MFLSGRAAAPLGQRARLLLPPTTGLILYLPAAVGVRARAGSSSSGSTSGAGSPGSAALAVARLARRPARRSATARELEVVRARGRALARRRKAGAGAVQRRAEAQCRAERGVRGPVRRLRAAALVRRAGHALPLRKHGSVPDGKMYVSLVLLLGHLYLGLIDPETRHALRRRRSAMCASSGRK